MLLCCSASPPVNTISWSGHSTKLPPPSFQSNYNLDTITFQNNTLLSSYSKSKSLDQTLQLFRLLPVRDTVTWNTIIYACSNHGRFSIALRLFHQMILTCTHQPDTLTFRPVLKACAETNNYLLALQVHAYMIKLQGLWSSDLITNTCLIDHYCKFGSTEIARELFDRIPLKDVVSFTAMMVGYNEAGNFKEALTMFRNMMGTDGLMLNEFALTSSLSASSGLSCLSVGEQIHACSIKASLQVNVFVGTALIDMYVKCNEMGLAEKAFSEISDPNVVSWNTLMGGDIGCGRVLQRFSEMQDSGVSPDNVTFTIVLRACKEVNISLVQQLHGLAIKVMGIELDVFVGGALFDAYVDWGCASDAGKVFEWIFRKDLLAYNLAIEGYVQNDYMAEAMNLFQEALEMGIEPNEATLVSLLMRVGSLSIGKQLHALIAKFGFCGDSDNGDAYIANSLITMYKKFSRLDDSIQVFNQIRSPDLVLWTSIISGFSQNGKSEEAVKLYLLLLEGLSEPPNHYTFSAALGACANLAAVEEGKQIHAQIVKSDCLTRTDLFIVSSLIDMYSKCGYIKEAKGLFDKVKVRDLALWNAMITGLAQHGYTKMAIETFQDLLNAQNLEPNDITFVAILSACSHTGLLEEGHQYFQSIREPTVAHYACLIDLIARAGHLEEARNLVEKMPFATNEVVWSSLLKASVIHRNIEVGEYSAKRLLQLNAKDSGTYVALSNIYAAVGQWDDVNRIRTLMKEKGVRKHPGSSWLTVNGETHVFFAAKDRNVHKYRGESITI